MSKRAIPWMGLGMAIALLMLMVHQAPALVDASLQPADLYASYQTVLTLRVAEIDEDDPAIMLKVIDRPKGQFAPETLRLEVVGDEATDAFYEAVMPDAVMVAFLDPVRRRGGEGMLFYLGEGHWAIAEPTDDPGRRRWTTHLDPQGPQTMFGVFNGKGIRLSEMMTDLASHRYFYPARPFTQFGEDRLIGRIGQAPAEGLGVADLDGDGDLDVIAASAERCLVLEGTEDGGFADRTQAWGLADAVGTSVSIADVDLDGRLDLLLGGRLFVQARSGRLDPVASFEPGADVKVAAFVEVNGDGRPDIVISRAGGGLSIHLNPPSGQLAFRDASAALGLTEIEACRTGNGFFTVGDFNGDRRVDLFFSVNSGVLLMQNEAGAFERLTAAPRLSFNATDASAGQTGGGGAAPLWREAGADLVVASEADVHLLTHDGKALVNLGPYANEITESEIGLLAALAADLNADGRVDVYAINRGRSSNMLYTNRGYGSFMTPRKYANDIFSGASHAAGARAAVATDLTGDGANDLLLALPDGSIVLVPNRSLESRRRSPHPNQQQQVLDRTALLSIEVRGPVGVVGAMVELIDEAGRTVGQRTVGHDVLTGCASPNIVHLAAREPGSHRLRVIWADCVSREWPIELSAGDHRRHRAARPHPTDPLP